MKRIWMLLLVLVLFPLHGQGAEEKPVRKYEAYTLTEITLRRAPDDHYRVATIKEDRKVSVYDVDGEWCLVGRGRDMGYVKTKYLYRFRSLDALRYPVPDRTVNAGILVLSDSCTITGGKFSGVTLPGGTAVCVLGQSEEKHQLAVWRGRGALPLAAGAYQPFIPWNRAQDGDLIGGFTTYYNHRTGAPRAKERAFNIEVGCSRVDGTIVPSLASFSFNAICAPYSQHNGYQYGPNISEKGFGYGGGVCQVSTTLYNATLALPLQVEEAAVHRKSGVQYIPRGFDAAVGTYTDLRFTNLLPYAIRLTADAQGGAVTVLIYRAEKPE